VESWLLAPLRDFWELLDRGHKAGEKKAFAKLEDLPGSRVLFFIAELILG
jgi:hypothetical protein